MGGRPRLPTAVAAASAAAIKNPGRFAGRKVKKGAAIGGASAHLDLYAKRAFEKFRRELPWLKESHRLLVELASIYRGQVLDPDVLPNLKTLQELRRCLGQLGATPADESKVNFADEEDEDPTDALFGKPN